MTLAARLLRACRRWFRQDYRPTMKEALDAWHRDCLNGYGNDPWAGW